MSGQAQDNGDWSKENTGHYAALLLHTPLLLGALQVLLEVVNLNAQDNVGIHLHKAPVAVKSKAPVTRLLGQSLHCDVVESQVQHCIHHSSRLLALSNRALSIRRVQRKLLECHGLRLRSPGIEARAPDRTDTSRGFGRIAELSPSSALDQLQRFLDLSSMHEAIMSRAM